MATEYTEWFTSWRRETWCNVTEANVLESYLEGALTLGEAAENITAPEKDRRLPVGSKDGRVWQLLFSCATNCPASHSAVIDLIQAITLLPKPQDKKNIDWSEQRTCFGETWRDNYDSLQCDTIAKYVAVHGSLSVSTSQKWINFNAFSAAFEAANIFPASVSGLGMYVIIDALEKKSTKNPQLEVKITAAGQWFVHASRIMLVNGKNMGSTLWGESESELWRGKSGFSKERWAFWKERMEILSLREVLSNETREVARRAFVNMGKAERALGKK